MKSFPPEKKSTHELPLKLLEWSGALIAVAAAIMLSLNITISPWAFVLYFISSVILAIWGWYSGAYAIAVQNMVFMLINSIAIYRWLIIAQ
ncbi:MAG TPA: hypothetical protein ENJ28_09495 [Gammaproteobacteria bacterium]|nr:hypothetical protein [Gammaproteobacteria bacterium]